MKRLRRRSPEQVEAILTADWHLRESQPTARTDDFWEAQWRAVDFVAELQEKYDVPIFHAGDLFHHWKPSPRLLSECIERLPNQFYTVYGNHDLPAHNLELAHKSGIYTLEKAGALQVLKGTHDGQQVVRESWVTNSNRYVLVWHVMTWTRDEPYPGVQEPPAIELLKRWMMMKLIVTGDNHIPFTVKYDGRLLVNPGSLTRQSAAQIDHKPRVYLWDEKNNEVRPIYLPIEKDAISRMHISIKDERDRRISAFIERLDQEWDSGLSFEENLKKFLANNNIRQSVEDIIWQAIEKESFDE
jgi:DNA repair exonuclease SbcCD nuclease subunit